MTFYVMVLVTDSPDMRYVLLQRKMRPEWQRGRYNLPGGKVEALESYFEAAQRELREEAGLDVPLRRLELFLVMRGDGFSCGVMRLVDAEALRAAEPQEDEPLQVVALDFLLRPETPPTLIPNLPWIVAMARESQRGAWPYRVDEAYASYSKAGAVDPSRIGPASELIQ